MENIERQKKQRQRTSRIIQKINIDSYEDTIIKRKFNNKEQIERLTKDLLNPENNRNTFLTINDKNKEMKEIDKKRKNKLIKIISNFSNYEESNSIGFNESNNIRKIKINTLDLIEKQNF